MNKIYSNSFLSLSDDQTNNFKKKRGNLESKINNLSVQMNTKNGGNETTKLINRAKFPIQYDLNKPYSLPRVIGGSLFFTPADFNNPCYRHLIFVDLLDLLEPYWSHLTLNGEKIFTDPINALRKLFAKESQENNCPGWIVQSDECVWFINNEKSLRFRHLAALQETLYNTVGAFLMEKDETLSYVIFDHSCGMTKRYSDDEMLMNRLYPQVELNPCKTFEELIKNKSSLPELLENDSKFREQILEKMVFLFPSVDAGDKKIAYVLKLKCVIWQKGSQLKLFPLDMNLNDHLEPKKPKIPSTFSFVSSLLPSLDQIMKIATPIFVLCSMVQSAWARTCENPNGNYHNNGPFQPLEIIKEGQLLTSTTHHWLYVVPWEQSILYDGVLMTNEKIGDDYFENRARFIDIESDGEVKLSPHRLISAYRSSDLYKPLSIGVELDSGRYVEILRRT